MEDVLNNVATNPLNVTYINFEAVTNQCKSFLDFGQFLKQMIWDKIGKNQPFDLVGHSMGGLDIRAAIALGENPLLNCRCCISVAVPQQGDHFGGFANFCMKYVPFFGDINKIRNISSSQKEQMKNLDPDYPPIKILNKVENRVAFFQRVKKFYEMKGLRDFTVKGSAFMDKTDIESLYQNKSEEIPVNGCDHTGPLGITRDVRVILAILYILSDIELDIEGGNCGIFAGGIDRPADNSNVFI
jgi:pimeloyl-ACP methyl ester carboxylesterase